MPQLTEHDPQDSPARCPLRLLGDPSAPRCLSLVLVRDAPEHERWHQHLDGLLEHALTDPGPGVVLAAEWPAQLRGEPAADPGGL